MMMIGHGLQCFLLALNVIAFVAVSGAAPAKLDCSGLNPSTFPSDWKAGYEEGWLLYANANPSDSRWMTSVGNGYVSTAIDSDTVYIGGVYNGNLTVQSPSHRARIPSTLSMSVGARGNFTVYAEALDIREAAFYRRSVDANRVVVEERYYAHQIYRNLLVAEITVTRQCSTLPASQAIDVDLAATPGLPSADIAFTTLTLPGNDDDENNTFKVQQGVTHVAEDPWVPLVTVAVVSTQVPKVVTLPANAAQQTWYFVSSFRTSLDSGDPVADALTDYAVALNMQTTLFQEHASAWRDGIWASRIDIDGNLNLLQNVRASQFYILSSLRADWTFGLSPGSLSSNGYNGHVFWDQETWMEPNLLMMFPELARSLIAYRWQRRGAAARFALQLSPSYKGTAFPWETAAAGNNACPAGYGTCTLEQHISGDIAFTIGQYWSSTRDDRWMQQVGYPTLLGIAQFWASRVVYNTTTQLYDINDVIPPDEYAADVNNSVYTNVVASLSFNLTIAAAKRLGLAYPAIWEDIAARLAIPFDPVKQIHLEYEGYTNETVKQADVILLGFPLLYPMSNAVRLNDLNFYLNVTDPGGPAMTWAMFTVGYLELNMKALADSLFDLSFLNIHPPFGVWAETASGDGAVNFITGAGGFLQGIINGYFGVRLQLDGAPDALTVCPVLPANSTRLAIQGLSYRGYRLRVAVTEENFTAEIISQEAVPSCRLQIRVQTGHVFSLPFTVGIEPTECYPFTFVCTPTA